MGVRPAAVAGRFYPADPSALADLVDGLLASARPEPASARPTPDPPTAAIAPHAGYQYSGAVAATVYARLAAWRDRITRVVLLGPAHVVPLDGMAVPSTGAFATPLGPVEIDGEARTAAVQHPDVAVHDAPHAPEHSLETQLPFLQRALCPDVPVLPVLVGRTPPESVAGLLAGIRSPGTVGIVSTDLSHYLDLPAARARDERTAAAIVAREWQALRPDDACGHRPLRGLVHVAAERRMDVELLCLATSADSGAEPRRVVGYGAFLLSESGDHGGG